jgi:hypothetical protein
VISKPNSGSIYINYSCKNHLYWYSNPGHIFHGRGLCYFNLIFERTWCWHRYSVVLFPSYRLYLIGTRMQDRIFGFVAFVPLFSSSKQTTLSWCRSSIIALIFRATVPSLTGTRTLGSFGGYGLCFCNLIFEESH